MSEIPDFKTFEEWSNYVKKVLTDGGFKVEDKQGFPFIPNETLDFNEKYRLLKFSIGISCTKAIYAEGVLIHLNQR